MNNWTCKNKHVKDRLGPSLVNFPLNMSVLLQVPVAVLPLGLPILQHAACATARTRLLVLYCRLCCPWTCSFYITVCFAPVDVSVLQQPVMSLDLDVYVLLQPVLPWTVCSTVHVLTWTCLLYNSRCCRGFACFTAVWTCLFYNRLFCPWIPEHVCSTAASAVPVDYILQQTVVHLYMSAYKSFCAALGRVCRACAAP
jgi:hypothetical protein